MWENKNVHTCVNSSSTITPRHSRDRLSTDFALNLAILMLNRMLRTWCYIVCYILCFTHKKYHYVCNFWGKAKLTNQLYTRPASYNRPGQIVATCSKWYTAAEDIAPIQYSTTGTHHLTTSPSLITDKILTNDSQSYLFHTSKHETLKNWTHWINQGAQLLTAGCLPALQCKCSCLHAPQLHGYTASLLTDHLLQHTSAWGKQSALQ